MSVLHRQNELEAVLSHFVPLLRLLQNHVVLFLRIEVGAEMPDDFRRAEPKHSFEAGIDVENLATVVQDHYALVERFKNVFHLDEPVRTLHLYFHGPPLDARRTEKKHLTGFLCRIPSRPKGVGGAVEYYAAESRKCLETANPIRLDRKVRPSSEWPSRC